ncbi:MAG TPA: hypothetical protein VHD87_12950 [Acidimicrobiales bacterium]|nr:hypothetical protein [Acidimicrobiales bacterium]
MMTFEELSAETAEALRALRARCGEAQVPYEEVLAKAALELASESGAEGRAQSIALLAEDHPEPAVHVSVMDWRLGSDNAGHSVRELLLELTSPGSEAVVRMWVGDYDGLVAITKDGVTFDLAAQLAMPFHLDADVAEQAVEMLVSIYNWVDSEVNYAAYPFRRAAGDRVVADVDAALAAHFSSVKAAD